MSESSDPSEHLLDLDVLRELVREAERNQDHQLHNMEEQDDKSEHLLGLGVAALAGGLAVTGLAAGGRATDVLPLAFLAAAGLVNMAALALFLHAYVGLRRAHERHTGPSAEWLWERTQRAGWRLEEHFLSLLARYPHLQAFNMNVLGAAARARRTGLWLLLAAVFGYALATFFILARRLHG